MCLSLFPARGTLLPICCFVQNSYEEVLCPVLLYLILLYCFLSLDKREIEGEWIWEEGRWEGGHGRSGRRETVLYEIINFHFF